MPSLPEKLKKVTGANGLPVRRPSFGKGKEKSESIPITGKNSRLFPPRTAKT
jgi:hypothetical protein